MKYSDAVAGIPWDSIEAIRKRLEGSVALHYIDGRFVESAATFPTLDPSTNQVLSHAARGGAKEVDLAAQAAARAFEKWSRTRAKERKRHLLKVAELIEKHADELAVIECLDAGQVLRIVRAQVGRAAENFAFYAEYAEHVMEGHTYPVDREWLNYTLRVPVGPVGVITPWNAPLMLSTWRIAPALAAGDTVILKPAEWSPLTATRLAEILQEADLPPGVFNVVHGFGERAGAPLVAHPGVQLISFTGETATGIEIMRNGAATLKRYSMELGGKNAAIVFPDADLEQALDGVIWQAFSLNGERCTANSRLLLHRSIYEEFLGHLFERVAAIRVGDPFDPQTEVGPLIHPEHWQRVRGYMEVARSEGATIALGGDRPPHLPEGNYFAPTVIVDARPEMRVAQEEIFGPVLVVLPFETEEEAIRIANGVKYGLAAYIWTRDLVRAHRVAQAMEVGMVWINAPNVRDLRTP
ncbi:MAG: 5-carboxymethyl-2-hydroxymuconate semialdehyde dehydrogenase, partial [Thermus sp.]